MCAGGSGLGQRVGEEEFAGAGLDSARDVENERHVPTAVVASLGVELGGLVIGDRLGLVTQAGPWLGVVDDAHVVQNPGLGCPDLGCPDSPSSVEVTSHDEKGKETTGAPPGRPEPSQMGP
jgi:hypothetical protein